MNIGLIGYGRLGGPVALVMDMKSHDVMCYDANPKVMQKEFWPHREKSPIPNISISEAFKRSNLKFGSVEEVVKHSDLIFIAVQTPHQEKYEGITPLDDDRADFDYSYLFSAYTEIAGEAKKQNKYVVISIISTVLPGTIRRVILPHLNEFVSVIYTPSFIAMGMTCLDFLNHEFYLVGTDDNENVSIEKITEFYHSINPETPIALMRIEEAELSKVAYNLFIGQKIVFANTLMEICDRIGGMDVDVVTDALRMAKDRLISGKYLKGGMGDSGGCHPRDSIAMSWLSREIGLSYDIFSSIMQAREYHAEYLCKLLMECQDDFDLPIMILGKAYKPETNLALGSCSVLCLNILCSKFGQNAEIYDPYIDDSRDLSKEPRVYLIGTNHPDWRKYKFHRGSLIVDPWGEFPDIEDCVVIRVGRRV